MGSSKYKIDCCKIVGSVILLSLLLHSQHTRPANAFSSVVTYGRKKQISKTASMLRSMPATTTNNGNFVGEDDVTDSLLPSRRSILMQILTATAGTVTGTMMVSSTPDVCHAASSKTIDAETAYSNLRKAREELVVAGRTYFPKQDWAGLREYLDNEESCINNYDANASALLTSKRLDADSKKAIGTIRRFGVGADVIIMYGGLKAEIAEDNDRPNSAEIQKYYVRTLDSLEEVIAIVRSNPGFSKIN
jgi:hypothetical protein